MAKKFTSLLRIKIKLKGIALKLRRLLPHSIQSRWFGIPAGITTTIDYCKSKDYSFSLLQSQEKVFRLPPETPEKEIHWKFCLEHEKIHHHPDVWLTQLENAYVISSSGHVLTSDRLFLTDASIEFGIKDPYQGSLFQNYVALPKSRFLSGISTLLCGPSANGYFHWLTDALPRIAVLLQSGMNLQEIQNFLIPENNLPAIEESLNLLGIESSRCRTVSHKQCFHVEELILPSLPGATGNPAPWVRDFLRNSFLSAAESVPDNLPQSFFISRKESRSVTNEDEILPILQEYGMKIIQPEKLSFLEQVALFARAKLIIAPHGAALTNLMFSSSETSVIELFSPAYVNVCFWAIANLGGLQYSYLLGEGKKYAKGYDPHLGRENMVISACCLRDWLKNWL